MYGSAFVSASLQQNRGNPESGLLTDPKQYRQLRLVHWWKDVEEKTIFATLSISLKRIVRNAATYKPFWLLE